MSERPTEVVKRIVVEINGRFGMSTARRAELCADLLLESGDDEAILLVLKSGFQRELSRALSELKASTRGARSSAVNGSPTSAHAEQLAFPVVVPGSAAVPLVRATHRIIRLALSAEIQQLEGRQRNIDALRRFAHVTAAWPDRTVGDLLSAGLISADQLATERQAA